MEITTFCLRRVLKPRYNRNFRMVNISEAKMSLKNLPLRRLLKTSVYKMWALPLASVFALRGFANSGGYASWQRSITRISLQSIG